MVPHITLFEVYLCTFLTFLVQRIVLSIVMKSQTSSSEPWVTHKVVLHCFLICSKWLFRAEHWNKNHLHSHKEQHPHRPLIAALLSPSVLQRSFTQSSSETVYDHNLKGFYTFWSFSRFIYTLLEMVIAIIYFCKEVKYLLIFNPISLLKPSNKKSHWDRI